MIDWQTPAALGVVLLTLVIFLSSGRKKKACGGKCDCPVKK